MGLLNDVKHGVNKGFFLAIPNLDLVGRVWKKNSEELLYWSCLRVVDDHHEFLLFFVLGLVNWAVSNCFVLSSDTSQNVR